MAWNLFETQSNAPSMWGDLWHGRLSNFGRAALSAASFGASLTLGFVVLGVISTAGRVSDEIAALVMVVAGLVWLLTLAYLWFGHAVLGPILRGAFALSAIWFVAILLAVIAESQSYNEEIWISACIAGGLTATALLVASTLYTRFRGRSIVSSAGMVNVQCMQCGYSLVGKTDCTCPECGRQYTIDEIISLQNYEALRGPRNGAGVHRTLASAPAGGAGHEAATAE